MNNILTSFNLKQREQGRSRCAKVLCQLNTMTSCFREWRGSLSYYIRFWGPKSSSFTFIPPNSNAGIKTNPNPKHDSESESETRIRIESESSRMWGKFSRTLLMRLGQKSICQYEIGQKQNRIQKPTLLAKNSQRRLFFFRFFACTVSMRLL